MKMRELSASFKYSRAVNHYDMLLLLDASEEELSKALAEVEAARKEMEASEVDIG